MKVHDLMSKVFKMFPYNWVLRCFISSGMLLNASWVRFLNSLVFPKACLYTLSWRNSTERSNRRSNQHNKVVSMFHLSWFFGIQACSKVAKHFTNPLQIINNAIRRSAILEKQVVLNLVISVTHTCYQLNISISFAEK